MNRHPMDTATRLLGLGVFLAMGLSGCAAGSRDVGPPPPPPIPGLGRVKSVTVLPVHFNLEPTRFSKPAPESTIVGLHRRTESLLKQEIERLVASSRFGLRRLDTDDPTLQQKPWLFQLTRMHLEQPDRALLRTIASECPPTSSMDIVDFAVDSTGAQYLLFVEGYGSYSTRPGSKWFDETVPRAVGTAIVGAILGVHPTPETDLEESAVEMGFYLEARLVDVADRQILWHNSVSYEKRIQEDDDSFDPRKREDLRAACVRLMKPLLAAGW